MDSDADSPSDESGERVSRKTPNFTSKPFLAIAVFAILFSPVASSDFESNYDRHCGRVVPRSPPHPNRVDLPFAMPSELYPGYFYGGAPIFDAKGSAGKAFRIVFLRGFADVVSELRANLLLEASSPLSDSVNGGLTNPRLVRFRGPRAPMEGRRSTFRLRGFWSKVSGELCMVGLGSKRNVGTQKPLSLSAVLKLTYPLNSTIYGSLVRGSLESLDGSDSDGYFAPVSILGMAQNSGHNYTLVKKDSDCLTGVNGGGGEEGVQGSAHPEKACSVLRKLEILELEYSGANSNPLGEGFGFVPRNMVFSRSRCSEDKKWQMVLSFPNSSYIDYRLSFDPKTALVGEGGWNEKDDRFCGVACRILNVSGESFDRASVGDCSTRVSLRIPTSFSLRNRSNVVGKMWSTVGHFGEFGFNHFDTWLMRSVGFKYEYTVIDDAFTRSCAKKNSATGKGKKYPAEDSFDMRFHMSLKSGKGLNADGYSTPFFVGNRWMGSGFYPRAGQEFSVVSNNSLGSLVNISYDISFSVPTGFKFGRGGGGNPSTRDSVMISAEGIYNRDNGVLCMIGCRKVSLNGQNSLDCEIAINIQFSSLGTKTNTDIKGKIESTRNRSDPLYFESLELSSTSMYRGQAEESIWRMDLEITMVLVSKTLTCVFVGLQLFYVKSRPEVLPFTSVAMLVVLTVGHMIPLLLNFEALFASHRTQQTNFLGNGGWLEVNEVVVRMVTMVVFLLQLRLLHLTWSSKKSSDPGENRSWGSERKVIYVILPLYACGALIAWLASHLKNSSRLGFGNPHRMTYVVTPFQRRSFQRVSLWKDLKSYAGLVMDGFLFPQILFNVFSGSGEKALAPAFYAGTTVVRILPHAYDLYRARSFSPFLDSSYIYASHKADFFSTAWDIVIPCGGLLFAALIFLQQRLGGRCVLPRRFRESSVYEKVPAISNDEL